MTQRKAKSYTLWMKYRGLEWSKAFTVLNNNDVSLCVRKSPILLLKIFMQDYSYYWIRGKTWMILPDNKKPAGMKK